jgi:hypothetical protein
MIYAVNNGRYTGREVLKVLKLQVHPEQQDRAQRMI